MSFSGLRFLKIKIIEQNFTCTTIISHANEILNAEPDVINTSCHCCVNPIKCLKLLSNLPLLNEIKHSVFSGFCHTDTMVYVEWIYDNPETRCRNYLNNHVSIKHGFFFQHLPLKINFIRDRIYKFEYWTTNGVWLLENLANKSSMECTFWCGLLDNVEAHKSKDIL